MMTYGKMQMKVAAVTGWETPGLHPPLSITEWGAGGSLGPTSIDSILALQGSSPSPASSSMGACHALRLQAKALSSSPHASFSPPRSPTGSKPSSPPNSATAWRTFCTAAAPSCAPGCAGAAWCARPRRRPSPTCARLRTAKPCTAGRAGTTCGSGAPPAHPARSSPPPPSATATTTLPTRSEGASCSLSHLAPSCLIKCRVHSCCPRLSGLVRVRGRGERGGEPGAACRAVGRTGP